jgi:hypothetical protein
MVGSNNVVSVTKVLFQKVVVGKQVGSGRMVAVVAIAEEEKCFVGSSASGFVRSGGLHVPEPKPCLPWSASV